MPEGVGGRSDYPESALDFHLEINDVTSSRVVIDNKKRFDDLNRDYSNSNLNESELRQLRNLNLLYELCIDIGAEKSKVWTLRKIYAILNTARSKNGFERKMTVSQFRSGSLKTEQSFEDKGSSKFMLFGGKKKSKGGSAAFNQNEG